MPFDKAPNPPSVINSMGAFDAKDATVSQVKIGQQVRQIVPIQNSTKIIKTQEVATSNREVSNSNFRKSGENIYDSKDSVMKEYITRLLTVIEFSKDEACDLNTLVILLEQAIEKSLFLNTNP